MRLKHAISLALLLACGQAAAGAVVVAAEAPASALSEDQVKRLFLGREQSLAGTPVTLVYQKSGPVRDAFENKILGKSGAELTSYWSKLIFTGRAKAPEEVSHDAAVKAKLATTPGAVGYVDDSAVDASVKVLFRF